ncbi:hypothetical protein [Vulcanimicrobium alpinum]|nr:hypothetical protein [Vulcanimicrobium alpinum]
MTDVFAPGTAPLPEGLRTLNVSPGRTIEPGQTIHATFTFRNFGGGTATGFRVRFRLPEGLTYLVGTARIDDTAIDEHGGLTSLLQSSGASIGDVPPGGERRISLAYSVAPTIENGTQIALQAAIASFEVPLIGSNVVRLVVRSRPTLQGSTTKLSLTPVREAVPDAELQLRAQIHNSGQSSAHDVIVLLPLPAHTSYVAGSAKVDGRAPAEGDAEPFGPSRPTIVAPTLGPGATLDVGYRVRIDATLEDATAIAARGSVCSQELPEFALATVTLKIPSKPSFAGEETSFTVDCEDDVVPGQRIRLTARARNIGTARARNVKVKIKLPDGFTYSGGSRRVDGATLVDREKDFGLFELGDLEPGRSVEVSLAGIVRSPVKNGTELPFAARIDWAKGDRSFDRAVTVRSAPAFPAAFNTIERETPKRVSPGDAAVFTIRIENMGTDAATDARLQLDVDEGLSQLKASDRDGELTIGDDGAVHLDKLEPSAARTIKLEARVAPAIEDQTQLRVRARLQTAQLDEIDLGSAVHVASSRPRFSTKGSALVLEGNEVLRPNRTTACKLTLHNEGTDRGRDVRVRLFLTDELRLENVEGASRDGDTVVFGEVPAQESREAIVHLRLVGSVSADDSLEVGARLSGLNVVPFSLESMTLETHAEASFAEGATLTALPAEAVDAGDEIVYTLSLRNHGDGAAKRLNARLDAPTNAVYAPGSTTVNDVALLDFAGTSPLLVASGLTLGDVGAGVEVIARLRMIVNTPVPAGSTIETRAHVLWDEQPEMVVQAEPLRVRSAPALPIVDPTLPFSVLDAAAGRIQGVRHQQAALPGETTYIQLPPAVPVRGTNGARTDTAIPADELAQLIAAPEHPAPHAATVALALTAERLEWTVQYLEEARFPGLLGHLMVLRALTPNRAETPEATSALVAYGALVDELVDRLFIKLRVPKSVLERDDIETRGARVALQAAIEALRAHTSYAGIEETGLQLIGTVGADELASAASLLERAKLVTAAPWRVATMLLGTSLERDGESVADFSPYRDALQRTLTAMEALNPTEFATGLHAPVDVELEIERESLLRALGDQRRVRA